MAPSPPSRSRGNLDPCVDFYRHACGGWLARTEIPADVPLTSRLLERIGPLIEDLRQMITEASPGTAIHRYYQACLDTEAIEAASPGAIAELVALVGESHGAEATARALARLQLADVSTRYLKSQQQHAMDDRVSTLDRDLTTLADEPSTLVGGCHCEAIRYRVRGEASTHVLCHCADCRRHSGAPMVGWAMYPASALVVTKGAPKVYASSEHGRRHFCSECGTGLFYTNEAILPGIVDVQSATYDDPDAIAPRAHVQVAERIAWMAHAHDLPMFERHAQPTPQ